MRTLRHLGRAGRFDASGGRPPPVKKQTAIAHSRSKGWWETVRTLVYAVAIALAVRTLAYEPFNIPSGSMKPTLLVGDYLFVSKFAYGYSRHSLPFSLPLFEGRIFGSLPERGDVAVFKLPSDNRTDYIKRIVGLPGDEMQVLDGVLHVNGEAATRVRIEDFADDDGTSNGSAARYRETLPSGRSFDVLDLMARGSLDNTDVYEVPQGHVFAMGDNRDNSLDSRVEGVGFIPIENLIGRAEIIFFSTNGSARIWEIWDWPAHDPLQPAVPTDRLRASRGSQAPWPRLQANSKRGSATSFADRQLLTRGADPQQRGWRRRHRARSNERLEFLGDRVVGLAVADLLIRRYPREPEGALSPRPPALVRERPGRGGARAWAGRLAGGRQKRGGGAAARKRPALLADASRR